MAADARATFAFAARFNVPRHRCIQNGFAVSARARTLFALPLAVVALGATTATAAHAAWSGSEPVSDRLATNLHAAGNRHGSEAFVWKLTSSKLVRLPAQTGFASRVRARIRLTDGRLGRTQTISSTRELVAGPQVGVAESGDAWAVWTQAGRHIRIMGAFHPRGKPFGTPFELGRSSHFTDARPQIAVGRFGDVAVVWNAGRSVRVVRRAGNAQCPPSRALACFRTPISLRAGADHTVAIGPLGSAYVVWAANAASSDGDGRSRLRMTVVRRSNRQGRDHAITGAADRSASRPSIAVRGDGTADIAWRASLPTGGEQNESAPIWAAASGPDAVTTAPAQVSSGLAEQPVVRVNHQGEAILAWDEHDPAPGAPEGSRIVVAIRAVGAPTFGVPTVISAANAATTGAALAVDAAGTAYLAYASTVPTAPLTRAGVSHVRPAGGVFGAPLALPAGIERPSLVSAGAKVSAFSTATDEPIVVSDWTAP